MCIITIYDGQINLKIDNSNDTRWSESTDAKLKSQNWACTIWIICFQQTI